MLMDLGAWRRLCFCRLSSCCRLLPVLLATSYLVLCEVSHQSSGLVGTIGSFQRLRHGLVIVFRVSWLLRLDDAMVLTFSSFSFQ